jgi:pimeloyl-ACP methyl ester carboxylesterase
LKKEIAMDHTSFTTLPASQQIDTNGTLITYYESGEGLPLLLLHGWPQTAHIWRKIIPELQKHYRVIAIDLPGMGNSNTAAGSDSLTIAKLIKAFCTKLNINELHLLAHDIGAWVAVTFALEYQHMLKSLIILDAGIPGFMPDEAFSPLNAQKVWQFYFHAIDELPEFLIEGKEREYFNWYFDKKSAVKDAFSPEDISVYVNAYRGSKRLSSSFNYYRSFTQNTAQNRSYQHKLTVPILAVGGEFAQAENVGLAMQRVSGRPITAVTLPNCGHYIPEEQPDMLIEMSLPFLKTNSINTRV